MLLHPARPEPRPETAAAAARRERRADDNDGGGSDGDYVEDLLRELDD